MKKAFLIAHPAGHSLSPQMHNAAFQHLGLEAIYSALDVAPEQLANVIEGFRAKDIYGANVTIPHKLAVMPFLDALTDAARAIGAVNTIINQNGHLLGHNTDASGFIRALHEDGGFNPENKAVVMLGSGGAARAIAYALLKAGVAGLQVYNRTPQKARALVEAFGDLGDIQVCERLEAARAADLLVNTTSVGMEHHGLDPDETLLPEALLPEAGFVCDIIYRPAKTRLLRKAEAKGLKIQNGLPMLVYQGAEAFERWTHVKAPIKVMMEALQNALAKD